MFVVLLPFLVVLVLTAWMDLSCQWFQVQNVFCFDVLFSNYWLDFFLCQKGQTLHNIFGLGLFVAVVCLYVCLSVGNKKPN